MRTAIVSVVAAEEKYANERPVIARNGSADLTASLLRHRVQHPEVMQLRRHRGHRQPAPGFS